MIRIDLLCESMIDAVLELENLCFPEDPWGRISFEHELTNPFSVFLVATDDESDAVVGYGGLWLMYDAGNITNIAVHPQYRREGIGSRILELLTQISAERGMETITLEVRRSNLAAQKLYEKNAFSVCGIRKRYYQRKEDAIIMTKQLKGEQSEYADIGN